MLRSLEEPDKTFRTNVAGTHALLEAGRAAGVTSLAFASTNAVTGPDGAAEDHRGRQAAPAHPVRVDQGRRRDAHVGLHRLLWTALRLHPPHQRLRSGYAGQGQHRRPADALHPPGHDVRGLRRRLAGARLRPRPRRRRRDAPRPDLRRVGGVDGDRVGQLAVGARGDRGRQARVRRRHRLHARPGQARRDARGDRRSRSRPRRRLDAAVPRSRRRSGGSLGRVVARPTSRRRRRDDRRSTSSRDEHDRLDPAERGRGRGLPGSASRRRRRAAGRRHPRLQRGADRRRGDRGDPRRGGRPADRGDRRRRRRQGRHRRRRRAGRRAGVRRPGQPRPGRRAAAGLLAGPRPGRPGDRHDRRRRPIRGR